MSAHDILMSAAGNGAGATTYVDDVFSAYTYTGTGSAASITINNGIDLTTYGGLTWFKSRSPTAYSHCLYDTARNFNKVLQTDTSGAQFSIDPAPPTTTTTGFVIPVGARQQINNLNQSMCSWTFRKQPKFFDIVTYTGTGVARTVAHSLGSVPGMVIVKRTDTAADWQVYHGSLANTEYILLNNTAAKATGATRWNSTTPTSTVFSLGTDITVNASGATYVAYLFAHDTTSTGLIQCGTFTSDGTGADVNLGFEAQWVLVKRSGGVGGAWYIIDTARGWEKGGTDKFLAANSVNVESSADFGHPTATGFNYGAALGSGTFIYMAIRRPNKPPTTGTQVYNAIARTGTGAAATVTGVGFAPDVYLSMTRSNGGNYHAFRDRLRGASSYGLDTTVTNAEIDTAAALTSLDMNGFTYNASTVDNDVGFTFINYLFKRAPGFFDEVCYTGNGTSLSVAHSLAAPPELFIIKCRDGVTNWSVPQTMISGGASFLALNSTAAISTVAAGTVLGNNSVYVAPTSTTFTLGSQVQSNNTGFNYVAYLFATLAGVSKVGSYTGNGTSQTIACGFSAGARFVLIKRTNAAGDWYVWDTARGIVTGNDPHLSVNTRNAEVTTNDSIDPASSGFIVNQLLSTNINVSAATYIFLAIA